MTAVRGWAVIGFDGEAFIAATGPGSNAIAIVEKLTGKDWQQLEANGCKLAEVTVTIQEARHDER